jgi:hypothetical protein
MTGPKKNESTRARNGFFRVLRTQADVYSLHHKKIWLPKVVYDALPYFYLIAGVAAIVATIYIDEWYWVVPHYVLFSAVCLHIGFLLLRKRRPSAIVERPHRFIS